MTNNILYDAYLSIGGNLGNRLFNIYETQRLLNQYVGQITNYSPIYISEPWGFEHKKYFLNQIIKIKTPLNPNNLLLKTKNIEKELGRKNNNTNHYQGRTADIDIICYENYIISNPEFEVPHPHLHKRLFVLLPMYDICPDWQHPVTGKSISILIKNCPDKSLIRKLNCDTHE
jgi:2-amino-4-hydroxy-6-hydroxymethyldihydropteridine diphosphokinase